MIQGNNKAEHFGIIAQEKRQPLPDGKIRRMVGVCVAPPTKEWVAQQARRRRISQSQFVDDILCHIRFGELEQLKAFMS